MIGDCPLNGLPPPHSEWDRDVATRRLMGQPLPSALTLQGVADRLHLDQAVPEYERVDAVLDESRGSVRCPFQEEDVMFIDLGFQVPGRVRHIGEQLCEGRPDAVLATLDAGRGDED